MMTARPHHAACIVCIGLIAVVVASCRQILEIDDREVESLGPRVCGLFDSALPGCAQCLNATCCDVVAACAEDVACSQLFACLSACTGDVASVTACRIGCRRESGGPGALAAATLACAARDCEDSCRLTCGGYLHASASCDACGFDACCAEARACAAQGACASVVSCVDDCGPLDGPCILACREGTGASAAGALEDCMQASCPTCGEPQWNCLGSVVWPEPTSSTVRLDVVVRDFQTLGPLAAHIAFCVDADCNTALDEADAGPNGGPATLEVPAASSGYLVLSGGAVTPSIYLPSGPLGVDRALLALTFTPSGFADLGPLDPSLGQLLLIARNCDGKLANGVAFRLATVADLTAEYWSGGAFGPDATETGAAGAGAIFDVPLPEATVVASVPSADFVLAERIAPLRPGVLTVLELGPEPE